VSPPSTPPASARPAPYLALRGRLEALAAELHAAGHAGAAEALREAVTAWWTAQRAWDEETARVLGAHHDIANALVGVRGHAQLLLLAPAGQEPGVRERLEVVLRETGRIQEAAGRIRDLKAAIGEPGVSARAA
jgi:nitrogen-specific signal transduction histidine kinase